MGVKERDFAADRAICDAATSGPWRFERDESDECDEGGFVAGVGVEACVCHFGYSTQYYPTEGNPPSEEDARFIAEARTGWPAALDEIASLRKQLRRYTDIAFGHALSVADLRNALEQLNTEHERLQRAYAANIAAEIKREVDRELGSLHQKYYQSEI